MFRTGGYLLHALRAAGGQVLVFRSMHSAFVSRAGTREQNGQQVNIAWNVAAMYTAVISGYRAVRIP
jgi:hypothetical protein